MGVTRETLFAEVWAEPMTTVAKRYEVSSSFLARVCARLHVPHPPRGYWAKLRVGAKPAKLALPEARVGDELEWVREGSPRKQPAAPIVAAPKRRKSRAAADRPARHSLLVGARELFEKARVTRDEHLKPYKRNIVDIFVSREQLTRALDAANELFLALEDRGYRVVLGPSDARYRRADVDHWDADEKPTYYDERWSGPARPTLMFIGTVAFGLTLFEVSAQYEVRWDAKLSKHVRVDPAPAPRRTRRPAAPEWPLHKDWLASGRLGLHVYAPYVGVEWQRYWREVSSEQFSNLVPRIISDLESAAPDIVTLVADAERRAREEEIQWEAQRLKWRREEEERQRRARAAELEKSVCEKIERWRTAREFRAYVAETRALVDAAGLEIEPGGRIDEELRVALAHADAIDPHTSLRREIASMIQRPVAPAPASQQAGELPSPSVPDDE